MTTTLVFGASGSVGSALVPLLKAAGQTVLSATSKPATQAGQVHLDLLNAASIAPALAGVDQLFVMSPPGYTNQDVLLRPVFEAATKAGIKKVVFMTAMGADAVEAAPMRQAELALERSGLTYNIIRPNWFMQNFHTYWLHGIATQGKILLPVGDAKGSFIDVRDIAAVAAKLLSATTWDNQAFDLTGGEALNHTEVADILSGATGRSIAYQEITPDEMRQGLLSAGLPADYAEFMLMILGFFKQGYSAEVLPNVEKITGVAPRTFKKYAEEHRSRWS